MTLVLKNEVKSKIYPITSALGVYYIRITFANAVIYPSIDVNRTILASLPMVVFEREGTVKGK